MGSMLTSSHHLDVVQGASTRNLLNTSTQLTNGGDSPMRNRVTINDYLVPVTEIRQVKRVRFDPESPRFKEACIRLKIDMKDI